ncbi:MAG: septum formation protein Maf [Deltaproteobacteria bacterium]|nr:septum formation protein Maf [Deltaproteobacteria bacterium]
MAGNALILASASPRRQELLARAGLVFEVLPAHVDESPFPDEEPLIHASRVAASKAQAIARARLDAWVLGADTVVVVDRQILGKPQDAACARAMLERLSGRTHSVITGLCLVAPEGSDVGPCMEAVITEVDFRTIRQGEITAYISTGEWNGKAGGYAAQGIAAAFITSIRGSYTNVVGLPLAEVLVLLDRVGAPGADFSKGLPS